MRLGPNFPWKKPVLMLFKQRLLVMQKPTLLLSSFGPLLMLDPTIMTSAAPLVLRSSVIHP